MSGLRIEETVSIPLADGCRLAARIWLPDATRPAPAVLEYLPYRKDDVTAADDAMHHAYFAGCGYAGVRVDIRGSGDSGGVLTDEYSRQEGDDALEVIAWIAAQPWCTGKVGMMGISWGGFNSLQVAARRPPALKAIITVCSTDDRYADDSTTWAACPLGYYLLPGPPCSLLAFDVARPTRRSSASAGGRCGCSASRATSTSSSCGCATSVATTTGGTAPSARITPAIDAAGPRRRRLGRRLHQRGPPAAGEPRRPAQGPHRALGARLPAYRVSPARQIGFLQECVRWWDHWLKGRRHRRSWTSRCSAPGCRRASRRPRPMRSGRAAGWLKPPGRPASRSREFFISPGARADAAGPAASQIIASSLSTGVAFGEWCPYGAGELPADQRPDDGRSRMLRHRTSGGDTPGYFGRPRLTLEVSADVADGHLAARLMDVTPDGTSGRISYGLVNLLLPNGHPRAQPFEPDRVCHIDLRLNDVGYEIPAGHRLRASALDGVLATRRPCSSSSHGRRPRR